MGSIEDRIARLEASLEPKPGEADTRAGEKFKAELERLAECHRAYREEGVTVNLEQQSHASLLGLVMSYPYGEVPSEVVRTLWKVSERHSHGPESVFLKVARLCLESRGAA